MSKRSERREAERQAHKESYRLHREQQSQFAALPAPEVPTEVAPPTPAFNSTTHGCCANEILILAHEKRTDFKALERAWFQTYSSADEAATNLIHQLVAADWLHQRSNRTYAQVESQIFAEESNPLKWTDHHHKALARFQRYRTANQNAFKKALKTVQDYFKNRAAQADKAERLEIAKARQKIYELKNTPEPTWDQVRDINRQRAQANSETATQILPAQKSSKSPRQAQTAPLSVPKAPFSVTKHPQNLIGDVPGDYRTPGQVRNEGAAPPNTALPSFPSPLRSEIPILPPRRSEIHSRTAPPLRIGTAKPNDSSARIN